MVAQPPNHTEAADDAGCTLRAVACCLPRTIAAAGLLRCTLCLSKRCGVGLGLIYLNIEIRGYSLTYRRVVFFFY